MMNNRLNEGTTEEERQMSMQLLLNAIIHIFNIRMNLALLFIFKNDQKLAEISTVLHGVG